MSVPVAVTFPAEKGEAADGEVPPAADVTHLALGLRLAPRIG